MSVFDRVLQKTLTPLVLELKSSLCQLAKECSMNVVRIPHDITFNFREFTAAINQTCSKAWLRMHEERVHVFVAFWLTSSTYCYYSGAPAREARQRSTMGKKIW